MKDYYKILKDQGLSDKEIAESLILPRYLTDEESKKMDDELSEFIKNRKNMEHTKEEIIESITSELDDCLETHNAEIYNWTDKIIDVDLENQTITIKFSYNVVDEDNYIGLAFY